MLPTEEAPDGIAVALVESRVDQGVEEGVGVAEPEEDALPESREVIGAEGADELHGKEGNPADGKHPNESAHHHGGSLLLLLPPRVPFCLGGAVAGGEQHLRLLSRDPLEKVSRSFVKGQQVPVPLNFQGELPRFRWITIQHSVYMGAIVPTTPSPRLQNRRPVSCSFRYLMGNKQINL